MKDWVKDVMVSMVVAVIMAGASAYVTLAVAESRIEAAEHDRAAIRATQHEQRAAIDAHSVSIGRHAERMSALERAQQDRWDEVRKRLEIIEEYLRRGTWRPPREE